MKKQIGTPIWTTRDGREIPVTEMTDSHLVNTYKWLKRQRDTATKYASFIQTFFGLTPGTVAADMVDDEVKRK